MPRLQSYVVAILMEGYLIQRNSAFPHRIAGKKHGLAGRQRKVILPVRVDWEKEEKLSGKRVIGGKLVIGGRTLSFFCAIYKEAWRCQIGALAQRFHVFTFDFYGANKSPPRIECKMPR